MSDSVLLLLLVVFVTHLLVFVVMGLRRKQWYYLALVITFMFLSLSVVLKLMNPTATVIGLSLHQLLRWCAWAAAGVSIPWTIIRIYRRKN